MVKLVILLLNRPFTEFDCSRYRRSSEMGIFYLEIYGKLTGLLLSVQAIHGVQQIRV